jgi:hypothetical protein
VLFHQRTGGAHRCLRDRQVRYSGWLLPLCSMRIVGRHRRLPLAVLRGGETPGGVRSWHQCPGLERQEITRPSRTNVYCRPLRVRQYTAPMAIEPRKFKQCRIDGLGQALQKSISNNRLFRKKDCHGNELCMILRIICTCPANLWDNALERAKRHHSLMFTGT